MKQQAFQPLCSPVITPVSTTVDPLPPPKLKRRAKKNQILCQSLEQMRTLQTTNGRRVRVKFKIPQLNAQQKKKWDDGVKEAKARLASSQCENDNILGSRCLQQSSTNAYMKHIDGIRFFCYLIGDFDSMLILLKEAPPGRLPSVSVRTVKLFIKWKVMPQGSTLVDDGVAILDLEGNEVSCAGSWTAPDNIRQFSSAVSLCHTSRGNGGDYSEACKDCLSGKEQAENVQAFFGCEIHHPNRKLFRHGDPMTDTKLIDYMKQIFSEKSAYVERGDSPLTPNELLQVRDRLCSSNSLWDFQLYTMIILGVKLFLRSDELCSLTIEQFSEELAIVKGDYEFLEGIAVVIHGKSDKSPVTLQVWADHECPFFCPIRHLLFWIKISKIKSGYLFPSYERLNGAMAKNDWNGDNTLVPAVESSDIEELKEPMDIDEEDVVISYNTFQARLVGVLRSLFNAKERPGPWGTHTLRKTAYLMAIWGKGELADIKNAARHSTLKNAEKYYQDARALYDIDQVGENLFQTIIPKWRSIRLMEVQIAQSLNKTSYRFKNLFDSAVMLFKSLKIPENSSVLAALRYIGNAIPNAQTLDEQAKSIILEISQTNPTAAMKMETILTQILAREKNKISQSQGDSENIPDEKVEDAPVPSASFFSLLSPAVSLPSSGATPATTIAVHPAQVISRPISSPNVVALLPPTPPVLITTPTNANVSSLTTQRRNSSSARTYGPKSLDHKRGPLKNTALSGLEKLEICKDIEAYVRAEGGLSEFQNASRCFYFSSIAPIMKCYKKHFACKAEEFLESCSGLKRMSKFKCSCKV
jgi:hypothetical protein